MSRWLGELAHLVRRFAGHAASIRRPSLPAEDDVVWARSWLGDAEAELWAAQAPVDRIHSLAVARRVATPTDLTTCPAAPRWVVAAALLHDVGKADAPLGLTGRTVATLLELARVRRAPGSLGRYLCYPATGARWLEAAGSDPRVVAWAREHHLPPPRRSGTMPAAFAELLVAADRAADGDGADDGVGAASPAAPSPSAAVEQPDGAARPA